MKDKNIKYSPVQMFIRFTRKDNEFRDRALLVARDEKGQEFTFTYDDYLDDQQDLAVCDVTDQDKEA